MRLSAKPKLSAALLALASAASANEPLSVGETKVVSCAGGGFTYDLPQDATGKGYRLDFNSWPLNTVRLSDGGNNYSSANLNVSGSTTYTVTCSGNGGFMLHLSQVDGNRLFKFVSVPNTLIFAYDTSLRYFWQWETDASGVSNITLPFGTYKLLTVNGDVAVWYGGAPIEKASTLTVSASTPILSTGKIVQFQLGNRPVLANVQHNGDGTVTISGTDFGGKRGYVDFGGLVTNAAATITAWTPTSITAKVPAKAGPGCVRVFSKVGGWTEACL